MSIYGTQKFPELSELGHRILSVSKEVRWLESEADFFKRFGDDRAAADFEERAERARAELNELERQKNDNS